MTAALSIIRHRKFLRLSLLLCAILLPLTACKKEAAVPAPAATPPTAKPAAPAPAAPKEEPPAEFKARWPVGQRLVQRLETTTDTEGLNPLNQQPFKLANTQVQELTFTAVKERDGGGHEVEVETLAITTTNRIGTNAASVFTSRSDPRQDAKNNPLAGPLRKLVGGKVKYLTTADGKVAAGASPLVLSSLNNLLSDEAIKGWNTLHTGLPDKPVKPGDSWPVTRTQAFGPGTVSVDATNTFKSWEQRDGRRVALIESAGVIVAKPGAGGGPVTVTVEDGAKTSGKAWFDPALGVVVESTATSEFSIKMTFAKGQGTSSKARVVASSKLMDAPNPGAATAEAKPVTSPTESKPADAMPAKKPEPLKKP